MWPQDRWLNLQWSWVHKNIAVIKSNILEGNSGEEGFFLFFSFQKSQKRKIFPHMSRFNSLVGNRALLGLIYPTYIMYNIWGSKVLPYTILPHKAQLGLPKRHKQLNCRWILNIQYMMPRVCSISKLHVSSKSGGSKRKIKKGENLKSFVYPSSITGLRWDNKINKII